VRTSPITLRQGARVMFETGEQIERCSYFFIVS
jgi:hypothetical protein